MKKQEGVGDMDDSLDIYQRVLKENGWKVTKQRVMVLRALAESSDKHLTAEEIYEIIKKGHPEIGLATVYRTIQLLLELQIVERVNLADGFARYELNKTGSRRIGQHHHHHLVCIKCGKVISFEDDLLEQLEERIMETESFKVVDHELKFYGYCGKCREKSQEEE